MGECGFVRVFLVLVRGGCLSLTYRTDGEISYMFALAQNVVTDSIELVRSEGET